jgi:hypothetical protein
MKPADATDYDWRTLVTRLAPLIGDRSPHAVAAIVVRTPVGVQYS